MQFLKAGYFALAGVTMMAASWKMAQEVIGTAYLRAPAHPAIVAFGLTFFALPPLLTGLLCFGVLVTILREA